MLSATAGVGQTSLAPSGLGGLKLPVKFRSKSTVVNDAKPANLPFSYHEMLQSASASIQYTGGNGLQPVQKNHYVTGFAFFCRQELKLEKKLKIPVRIRMGSIEQCDKLEQKR